MTSALSKDQIARMVAEDIPVGSYVNLGIGLPTLVADHLIPERGVVLHTENGLLGMGPTPHLGEADPDLTNAGKQPVTALPGASYFDSAASFALMRGGHLDVCVLGAFQVSVRGDLANWNTGVADAIPAVGGAMDLAIGAKQVFVMMTLFDKEGRPKLVPECTYPLTGAGCVTRLYSEWGVIDVTEAGLCATRLIGVTEGELAGRLGVDFGTPVQQFRSI